MSNTLLPCPNCGAELSDADTEEGMTTFTPANADGEPEFTFQGKPAERPAPTRVCPECGKEVML